jgi:hypothetical protein
VTKSQDEQNEGRGKAKRTAAVLGVLAVIVYLAFITSGIL